MNKTIVAGMIVMLVTISGIVRAQSSLFLVQNVCTTNQSSRASLSLAISPVGKAAVLYNSRDILYFSERGETSWNQTAVDTNGQWVGHNSSSLAFGTDGYPSAAYSVTSPEELRYAKCNGASWTISVVEHESPVEVSTFSIDGVSLAFTPDGRPAISFYLNNGIVGGYNPYVLKYAEYSNGAWDIRTLFTSANKGYQPGRTSLVFTPDGRPAIGFSDNTVSLIQYAERSGKQVGSSWTLRTVAAPGLNVLENDTFLGFTGDGHPAIGFRTQAFSSPTGNVFCAKYDGTQWSTQSVDHVNGDAMDMAITPMGQPAMVYNSSTSPVLCYAECRGSVWVKQSIPITNATTSALVAFGPDGYPAVASFVGNSVFYADQLYIRALSQQGSGALLAITWPSVAGRHYTMQSSTNLLTTSAWTNVSNFVDQIATGSSMSYTTDVSSVTRKFFQIQAR